MLWFERGAVVLPSLTKHTPIARRLPLYPRGPPRKAQAHPFPSPVHPLDYEVSQALRQSNFCDL